MMKVRIHHTSRYKYARVVGFAPHLLFLYPRESQVVRAHHFAVKTEPEHTFRWVRDCFENILYRAEFGVNTAQVLSFEATIEVILRDENPFDFILEPHALSYPMRYHANERAALCAYLKEAAEPDASSILDWFYSSVSDPNRADNIVAFLSEINQAIFKGLSYTRRDEPGIQTPDETLELGSGSCRDMAVLMISLVRQLGLAARFVSGYLYDPPTDEHGERVYNRAHGSMHAWLEIYLPGAGWKGFDPTNGILTNHFFIPTAVSSVPAWVDPIQGRYYHDEEVDSELEIKLEMEEFA
ncbi:MAG: transglutaminase family protein [Verrucomicrobiota bacterium]